MDSTVGDAPHTIRRVLLSSIVGTAVEWYDFMIYAAATGLVFNKLFFPATDPAVSTIVAFATYALGFLARPVGGGDLRPLR